MKQSDRSDIIMSYGRRGNMDWMTGIQRAIDYVESHLDETVDYGAVAREAASSPFHFQRMFAMVCGYTLGDYIRMRRLSVAADELYRTDDRIIDIALRSGYDTPESFSRAFTRFHGISPSEARRGGNVKSFSRLSVKLILEGGNIMDYRIEKADAFKVICRRKRVEKPQGDIATDDISGFWRECTENGAVEKICRYADFGRFHGLRKSPKTASISLKFPRIPTRCSLAAAECPTLSERPTAGYAPNSSRRIPLTNTEAAWSLRFILRRTFRIPIIPARYGSPSKKRRTDEKGLPTRAAPFHFPKSPRLGKSELHAMKRRASPHPEGE